ncbi:MAG TPA: hypothetical protein VGT03_07730 [Candidatus Acidoferrales bacterium]|nr:hypothetical protein [Candidatus Acidoferrales bacterium]
MRTVMAALFVILSIGISSQTPGPVPIESEPHYHLLLQNDFARVYALQLAPHEETLPFVVQHDSISETVQNGQPADRFARVTGSAFQPSGMPESYARGPFTNVWRNDTDETYRSITVELLQPQGKVYGECTKIPGAQELGCQMGIQMGRSFFFNEKGSSASLPSFKTDKTGVFNLILFGGRQAALDVSDNALVIFDTESDVELGNKGKKKLNFGSGDVLWVAAGSHLSVKNRSKQPDRLTLILFR